jgi:hypothetical protein
LDALRTELEAKGVQDKEGSWAIGFWWSMISKAISSSSTIRTRLHAARLLEIKHDRPAPPRLDNGGAGTAAIP